jgi:hypothetical protein
MFSRNRASAKDPVTAWLREKSAFLLFWLGTLLILLVFHEPILRLAWSPIAQVCGGVLTLVFRNWLAMKSAQLRMLTTTPDEFTVSQYKSITIASGLLLITLGLSGLFMQFSARS